MSNRIRQTVLEVRRLSAVEAEVWIRAEVETVTPTTELRGRLVGPHCPGTATVSVAYPLRPLAASADALTARIVIPEPNLWTEKMPFVYAGTVELWEEGQCRDRAAVSVGLKSR